MQRVLWMWFDLGVRGDYQGMYAWLDSHKAKECGDNFACLSYEFKGDLIESLTEDLKRAVNVTNRTRVYVVWSEYEAPRVMKGKFIFGGRKAPPWTGYAAGAEQAVPDEG
jgi:hypothetical protein